MTFLTVLAIYFGVIFGLFFISKRDIGLPVLGLAAGALMAKLWTGDVTPLVAQAGFAITTPPLASIVFVALTFLPVILLMLRTPSAGSILYRVLYSAVFALFGVVLTYEAFSRAVVLDESSKQIVEQMLPYDAIVITLGIAFAIVAVLTRRQHRSPGRPKKK